MLRFGPKKKDGWENKPKNIPVGTYLSNSVFVFIKTPSLLTLGPFGDRDKGGKEVYCVRMDGWMDYLLPNRYVCHPAFGYFCFLFFIHFKSKIK